MNKVTFKDLSKDCGNKLYIYTLCSKESLTMVTFDRGIVVASTGLQAASKVGSRLIDLHCVPAIYSSDSKWDTFVFRIGGKTPRITCHIIECKTEWLDTDLLEVASSTYYPYD